MLFGRASARRLAPFLLSSTTSVRTLFVGESLLRPRLAAALLLPSQQHKQQQQTNLHHYTTTCITTTTSTSISSSSSSSSRHTWKGTIMPPPRRRSPRIRALSGKTSSVTEDDDSSKPNDTEKPVAKTRKRRSSSLSATTTTTNSKKIVDSTGDEIKKKKKTSPAKKKTTTTTTTSTTKKTTTKNKANSTSTTDKESEPPCLARTRELELKLSSSSSDGENNNDNSTTIIQYVLGIDEAGRGPLAGPVVAAAVICPTDIPGVVDSKKITKEDAREALYETIIVSNKVRWAVAVVDAKRIDEINILQATLEGMRQCATALVDPELLSLSKNNNVRVAKEASVKEEGCYVVIGNDDNNDNGIIRETATTNEEKGDEGSSPFFALIDGNKVPKDMPCPSESMVKGDSKEFSIAAASILAKVTRDRLMHAYDKLYPQYNLAQHKGYPTAAHMKVVHDIGASPIHRRTFAPLKHMEFDEFGKVI